MRGGGLHRWMVMQLESAASQAGYWTRIEAYVGNGFADLIIGKDDRLIVIEVELTPERIKRDVIKAQTIHADLLLIVAADSSHIPRMRRQIDHNPGSEIPILIRSYPSAISMFTEIGGYLDRTQLHRTQTPNQ